MRIKTWHKVIFFGSLGAFFIYYQRERVKMGYRYIKTKFADLIESFASEWVGVKEIGDNQAFGNDVFQNMLKRVGWSSTDQWCMYFAKAVHYEVYKDDREAIKKILVGNTQDSFVRAQNDKTGTYTVATHPQKGDIFIFQRTDDRAKGHAGIVTKVNSDGTMNTIEGNTSDKDVANGDTVARRIRPAVVGQNIKGSSLKLRGFIRKIEK